jgi:tRNA modification GTPase
MAKASSSGWSSVLAGGADTIVARATAAGRGALAVVRVSGPGSTALGGAVCPELDFQQPWRASLVNLVGADGSPLERAVAIPYLGPRSYTGEDMIEVLVHGSPFLVDVLVERFVAAGGRHAEPGEFTRRAVANGKIDLVQAEAVRDLIAADTEVQARLARDQLAGRLSSRFGELRDRLVELLSILEAVIEFSGQGPLVTDDEPRDLWRLCQSTIASLLATADAGERVRAGVRVAVIGPPNAGKSTLFNRLLGSERAIVDPQPGTTRDVIEADLEVAGVPTILADTAGLRESAVGVEGEGVRRTGAAIADAQVVIELMALDAPRTGWLAPGCGQHLCVRSKADLVPISQRQLAGGEMAVSSVTGEGIDSLRQRLGDAVRVQVAEAAVGVAINGRHRRALERAAGELSACDLGSPELAAEAVRWSLREVRSVTGEVMTDDLLDQVFGTFCIGK